MHTRTATKTALRVAAALLVTLLAWPTSARNGLPPSLLASMGSETGGVPPLWRAPHLPTEDVTQAWFDADVSRLGLPEPADVEVVEASPGDEEDEPPRPLSEAAPEAAPVVAPKNLKKATLSVGPPWSGWLVRGVPLPGSDHYKVRKWTRYGTPEVIDAMQRAVAAVHRAHPNTPKLYVGDLSRQGGGQLKRHKSHQTGRDADIAFYRTKHSDRFGVANRRNLDRARTWTFVEALVATGEVEKIFINRPIQKLLYEYARDVKKLSEAELARYFQYPRRGLVGIVRHVRGHDDHMHVRFHARHAREAAKAYVNKYGTKMFKPVPRRYTVRRGDNLWRIARKNKVPMKKLLRWNRISKKKLLRPGMKLVVGWRAPKIARF